MPRFEEFDVNGIRLHCAIDGPPQAPLIVALHGFPEYWAAWSGVAANLADDFLVVAPDQRGFNLSSKPAGVDAYRTRNMVEDLMALADRLSPDRPFILAGHDWGASVAYAFAFSHPDRLSHLIVANGVHPVCFQRALIGDPAQRLASQYIHKLRSPDAAYRMSADNFAKTLSMLAKFSRIDWLTPEVATSYRDAWSQPGAMEAMLNWYRASPLIVPLPGDQPPDAPLLDILPDRMKVSMPHFVVWGEDDEALLPACLRDLGEFAPDLTLKRVPGAGHWILHEKPRDVAEAIRTFVALAG